VSVRIDFSGAAEIVDSCTTRHKCPRLIRAREVDPRGAQAAAMPDDVTLPV
jgi:hypothetical protein